MQNLTTKAFGGLLGLLIVMAVLLLVPPGTLAYWQAWTFLGIFGGSALAITLYLIKRDPALLARRVYGGPTAEQALSQKIIQSLASLGFIGMLVVPALDHRLGWSSVPPYVTVAGEMLVALGFLIIFLVYRENSFTSATIQIAADQKVVSTGLYALVRHPMYMGALVLLIGMSPSLGSWWGLSLNLLVLPALIWRIFDEETYLTRGLTGYAEYVGKVKRRLVPFVW